MKLLKLNPVVRAIGVMGAVAVLVGGVTFAALADAATLTGNTIATESANADLLLYDGDSFEPTAPGFDLAELKPGEESDKFNFYFKNNGNVDLDVTARINVLPVLTGLDADQVTLKFYGACPDVLTVTLGQLSDGTPDALPCGPLVEGAQGVGGEDATNAANYQVTVTVDEAVELDEAPKTVGEFDLTFDGTAVTEEL
ncbi:MAG TPA: hypothetical protein VK694_01885 [Verrucomicrobiae bacterium]|nr:hypothetical protein [Verrucomicrobiae bacterium]